MITYEIINKDQIELCKDLCNELMAFQKEKAILAKEAFDNMNFDTRLKPSIEACDKYHVIIAKDNNSIIGYVFLSIEDTLNGDKSSIPEWAPKAKENEEVLAFYPNHIDYEQEVGCLNQLYLKENYRHLGIGNELLKQSLEWFKSYDNLKTIFVYISNGNQKALDFYLNNGFVYSHEVFSGFIQAAYYKI